MYNNASEVIREALRFMDQNEKLLYLLKVTSINAIRGIYRDGNEKM